MFNNKVFYVAIVSLLSFMTSVHAEFKAFDHDGFVRPKETKTETNKTKEVTLPAKEQTESKGSHYEDMDGFKRPKEPNKANEEKVKKEGNLPAKDQNESKGSIYEDMDGFKRPKKDQQHWC